MAHVIIKGTRKQAKKIFSSANMSTIGRDDKSLFSGGDCYRDIEHRNGFITINDVSCANESEVREKYSL